MADDESSDVPVNDVLCKAMEYLVKLGSNLQSRSASLKEKRMSKDKLKNFHAVQKAANKVLLICELSKKSIENVEVGIRKVLNVANASQTSTSKGGKRISDKLRQHSAEKSRRSIEDSNENTEEKQPHYYYFEYQSHKLKIAKRISLKHYRSVKVVAKRLPRSMLDKYPVHYNCKLYQMRKKMSMEDETVTEGNIDMEDKEEKVDSELPVERKAKTDSSLSDDDSVKIEKNKKNVSNHTSSDLDNEEKNDENQTNDYKRQSEDESNIDEEKSRNRDSSKMAENNNLKRKSKDESNAEEEKKSKKRNSSKTAENDLENLDFEKGESSRLHEKSKVDSDVEKKVKHRESRKQSKNDLDSSDDEKGLKDQENCNRSEDSDGSSSEKQNRDRQGFRESKNDSDDASHKNNEKYNNKYKRTKILVDDSSDEDSHENKSNEKNSTKSRRIQVVDDSSEEEKANQERNDEKIEIHSDASNHSDKNEFQTKEKHNEDKAQRVDSEPQKNSESIKPLIKLVSMSKLLKPGLLQEDNNIKPKHQQDQNSINRNTARKSNKGKKVRFDNVEDYWKQKRKEVKGFKAKEFSVCISKLPEISVAFLKAHGLSKVTQNGTVICDIVCTREENNLTKKICIVDNSVERSEGCDRDDTVEPDVIEKVKSALLNDSDSENSDAEAVKKSAPDSKTSEESPCQELFVKNGKSNTSMNLFDQIKNSLLNESDSDKNEEQNSDKSIADARKIKDALLNESDSDKNKEDSNGESNTQNIETLKNALLNESDSDKNNTDNDEGKYESDSKEGSNDNSRPKHINVEVKSKKVEQKINSSSSKGKDEQRNHKNTSRCKPAPKCRTNPSKESDSDSQNKDLSQKEKDHANYEKQDVEPNVSEGDNEVNNQCQEDMPYPKDNEDKTSQPVKKDGNDKIDNINFCEERSKTPEKELSPVSLANYNKSDSCVSKKSCKRKQSESTLNSKRKHIMESMHAKKMLLEHSSSSDSENEQLKSNVKDIKTSLLQTVSSEEESPKKLSQPQITSESEEDVQIKTVKKKKKLSKCLSKEQKPENTDEETHEGAEQESSSHQVDENNDDTSNSSSSKMGRSREKPTSSSSHSDTQEDKDIDGLTNLKSLNKSRRRPDSASNKTESSSNNKDRSPSTKHISGQEGLVEAPSSSEESSGAESDVIEEDLPSIKLSLNGSAMAHLAKDDLLVESDSDDSKDNDNNPDDVKKDTDSEAENIKSKRRKANAISSDSEAGSSQRKDPTIKMSDFEDSEEENSEPTKKSKRKKAVTDSDASAGSSDGGKKKRRRIKQIDDSDGSGSESEREGKNKHGRKNIRKVMGKNQLEEATKKAAREEKERMARIAERQQRYNNLEFDESGKPDEVILDKVILDFDPETKEPLIEVDRGLVKKLKPHQANGIKFMWDACFESVKRIKKDKGSGCILAHCMGLGKTLQVVSLTHTLLTNSELTGVNRVLVVCPLSTVLNWVNEFTMWLKHAEKDYEVDVYELSRFKQNSERAFQLSQWFKHGGVCVLGYEMFRNLSADNTKKYKKKMLKQFQESLVDPGPQLVVCDEGHLLKNEKTSLSQSMNRIKTRRRIVLTGTPLQNNLKEYYCMVQFVKPNLLGKYNEYLNRFVNPITNGQYTDSTEHDIRIMKRRSHVLHTMLDGAVQRRDYSVLAPFLPPKHEYVLFITLTEVQVKLYQHYLDNYSRRPLAGKSSGFLFPDFQSLQRIWTHPLVLKYNSERYEIMQQKKREREEEEDSEGSLADFIDDDSTPEESSSEESMSDLSDLSNDSHKKSKKKKSAKKSKDKKTIRRGTRANPVEQEEDEPLPDILEVKNDNPTEWWIPLVTDDELDDLRNSHKLVLLFEILRQCEAIGDKVLVFSQSLYSLDLIEYFLGKIDEATQEGRIDEKLNGHVGSWSPGIDYFRLDGSTSCENRSIWCKNFNREDNPRARLFLISTRAGGLGINLVAANRVIIFDVSWNPSHDVQSIFRVYRFGQKKPCYIYRFLAMGTMEEKIYERQVTKQAISKRVIDEQQIDRHYAENDLAELYKFEPRPPAPRPVPLVPKDRLFAEMIKEHEVMIYKFHEHDSLLENKEEETLSEEERKAAWEDFENEKNRPPPAPFPSWPMMNNGMNTNPLLQQQLAYAAVASMLRKDMPNLTDDQIRSMLPLIYGANPGMFGGYDYGLMQKLNDMYKYTQPGMGMNPAMMNPVMNAAAGGGAGGSSGLQYEPPWQRQLQQQQQQRLQQLLQHQQNPMNAKYYAGGLGSRDPVAMALQQQRAREMMLADRRPRGRPPAARAPVAPADVVNLDSD